MPELLIDFITSLDGYAAAEGWPDWWGLEGPEYLGWLGEQPEADYTVLMGAATYRPMPGCAAGGEPGTEGLAAMPKVVFSSTLSEPLSWANTQLVTQDPSEAVREMKEKAAQPMRTIGSLTLCRSLLKADLRRLSRCRAGDDQQPHLRRPHPAAGVRSDAPDRTAGRHNDQLLTATSGRTPSASRWPWAKPARAAG